MSDTLTHARGDHRQQTARPRPRPGPPPVVVTGPVVAPGPSGRARPLGFRPEIEGLRAVAVLLVLADHLFGRPSGGFVGVDVFFVISGFLITGLLVREIDATRRVSLRGFYVRRARRILPGALVVLATCAVVAHVAFPPTRVREVLTDTGWAAGFLANQHFAAIGTDYFHANRPPSPVQHYWSLSVEEQFYLVWPWALVVLTWCAVTVLRRRSRVGLVVAVGGLTAGAYVVAAAQTRADSSTAYFATTARAWKLGVGAFLAVALAGGRAIPVRVRRTALVGGLGLITVAAVTTKASSTFPAPAAAPAVAGAALVIAAGTGPLPVVLAWPLTNPVSRYVGRVSYSLYLWHWPVLVFLPVWTQRRDVWFDVAALAATGALTALSYHLVEDPLRRLDYRAAWSRRLPPGWRRRQPHRVHAGTRLDAGRRHVAAVAGVSLLAVAVVSVALQPLPPVEVSDVDVVDAPVDARTAPAGEIVPPRDVTDAVAAAAAAFTFPRLDPSIDRVADAHGPEWKLCGDVERATLRRCTFPARGRGPARTLVVLGDSFGIAWTPALRAAQGEGYTVVELTHSQCPAIDASFREDVGNSASFTQECNAARDFYVDEIARLRPDVVVIGNYDAMLNNLASRAKGSAAVDEWAAGARHIVERVEKAGARRIVWMTSPPLAADLTECAQKASARPSQCLRTVGDTWTQVRVAEQHALAGTGVTMLDTRLFFCTVDGRCPAFVGTTPTHTDGAHLTGAYARRIGPLVLPYVLGAKRTA